MTSVKEPVAAAEVQVPLLMGRLFAQVAETFAAEDWGGLRQSHFRVVSGVPKEGVSVTELARRLGMTKQGCGQFVTHLAGTGHLSVERAPQDRRVRVVRRTPRGEDLIRAVTDRILRIEADWAAQVGERRYRTFRSVLEELALGS